MPKTLDGLAQAGAVPPSDFFEVPQRVREVAALPLALPTLQHAKDIVAAAGFYHPTMVEDLFVALSMGNVILAGPPGTGKTTLAKAVATAFNCNLATETATPEWSVFDTVGTQTLAADGAVLPKNGVVTQSILTCANMIVAHADSGEGSQGQWLLIDEMNRAEIDRAFGPLFTALAGGSEPSFTLDHLKERPSLAVPARFRLIATVNEYDSRFVNSMSAALRRRFAKVLVLPPTNDDDGRMPEKEWETALSTARISVVEKVGELPPGLLESLASRADEIRSIVGFFRASPDHGGIPVGTATVIDTLAYLLALGTATGTIESDDLLDRSFSARFLPFLESDSTRTRIDDGFASALLSKFSRLRTTAARISAFLSGLD